ncbi:hypothetical protein [Neorhizobium sp. JUb45]|uniref:hypothetical protein n=1 Tax=unclassified Neorhizobium TaxID=2629175 RepID=UPI001A9F036E|nr:hypothetical protein [Neorhizobium sp. JUb45]
MALGALSGLWIHIVAFALLTVVVLAAYVTSLVFAGLPLAPAIMTGVYLWWALGAGFVVGHLCRHALRFRRAASKSTDGKLDQVQKYMKD